MGSRCADCYWQERSVRLAAQLAELIGHARARAAFHEYVVWLRKAKDARRTALQIPKHVEFFVVLGKFKDAPWTETLLLEQLGASGLRKFETPTKWLVQTHGMDFSGRAKRDVADTRLVQSMIEELPVDSFARSLLEQFVTELQHRQAQGKLSVRSARLALRPAVALLQQEDPAGRRVPSQLALDELLAARPGYRASVSTFLGYLKSTQRAALNCKRTAASEQLLRTRLEQRLAQLVEEGPGADDFTDRWLDAGLRYFHRLGPTQSERVRKSGEVAVSSEGYTIRVDAIEYWIPKPSIS